MAMRTGTRSGSGEVAIATADALCGLVVDQPDITIGTLEGLLAMSTDEVRGIATTIEEEDAFVSRLALVEESFA